MNFMTGISFSDWIGLLAKNKFAIKPSYLGRSLKISIVSIINSLYKKKEINKFQKLYENVKIKDPIFIIGHWRSGTTLVHKLFSLDEQFAYPNLFEVSNPHTFLIRGETVKRALANAPAQKRPMDNMEVTFLDPGEDESAISMMCQKSPLISWGFCKKDEDYYKYHTFNNKSEKDFEKWKGSFLTFLKKLTYKYDKQLVLKSPIHTGRIKILLNLFPNAKFIHIYRNPYTVFQSTKRLYESMLPTTCLQSYNMDNWEEYILRNYKIIHDSFFKEKELIPKENYHEVSFEDFEKDIVKSFSNIYENLGLKGFLQIEKIIEKYIYSNSNYKKNKHHELSDEEKNKIFNRWERNFDEWNYPK